MTKILQLVTDFSFASGDHIYIAQLLAHLRKVHGERCSLHVAELAGHGGGPNRFIYEAMSDLDVTVHQLSSYEGGNLDFVIPSKVEELLRSLQPDIVHSHHFFTDLCALICRMGGARYLREIAQMEHARFLPQLVELIEHLGKDRLFSALLQDILPLRTWETGSVIEPAAFRWLSTKHATEPLSIANRSAIDGLYEPGTLVHTVVTELNTGLQRLVSGAVDQVVTINVAAENAWNLIGITSETINVAAVGDVERQLIRAAKAERDTIRRLFNVGEGGNLFLFASRMSKKKQPVALARAFREHLERWPLDRLVLVGEGSETRECQQIAADEPRISVLGFRPREALFPLMTAADAFCLFSVEEGLPLSIMEAAACDLPILTTPVGGIPEIVHDGVNGMMAVGTGQAAIADTLARFAALPQNARRALGSSDFHTIEATRTFEAYWSLYQELASRRIAA